MRGLQQHEQPVIWQMPDELGFDKWKYLLVVLSFATCSVLSFVFSAFGSQILQEMFFLGLTVPLALQAKFKMINLRSAVTALGSATPYLVALWASLLGNIDRDRNLFFNFVVLTNVNLAFLAFSLAQSKPGSTISDDINKAVFVMALPFFAYITITAPSYVGVWGRWAPLGQQPNWWGMMALGLAWAGFGFRHLSVRLAGLAVALFVMVQVQSRGALLALLPTLAISSEFFRPSISKRVTQLSFVVLIFGIAVALFSEYSLSVETIRQKVFDYFLNDIAKLNDPQRGLNSGLTGRTTSYEAAWKAFLGSPIIGAGFGSMDFVHNGVLLALGESGFLGAVGLVFLFVSSLVRAFKSRDWNSIGCILSYILIIMTFPRSININFASLLCIMVLTKQYPPSPDGVRGSVTKFRAPMG